MRSSKEISEQIEKQAKHNSILNEGFGHADHDLDLQTELEQSLAIEFKKEWTKEVFERRKQEWNALSQDHKMDHQFKNGWLGFNFHSLMKAKELHK